MPANGLPYMYKRTERLMGNRFEIGVVAESEAWAHERIGEAIDEIRRIERLLTTFSDDSQTQQINHNAGLRPVPVVREVFDLIARACRLSDLTQGAFDLSYGSIDKSLWNFDQTMTALPSPQTARKMVRLINYKNIILDREKQTVFLAEKGMRIGFGGIGKGYAAEMAKRLLLENGVVSGVVNASGDLATWGHRPDGNPWTIGLADPDAQDRPFSYLEISGLAVATSGNYEKFVTIDGRRYSHTINPRTGLPVTGIKSVTIISPNAELSDALATPVYVMGTRVGLNLINQMRDIACVIIDEQNQVFCSDSITVKG